MRSLQSSAVRSSGVFLAVTAVCTFAALAQEPTPAPKPTPENQTPPVTAKERGATISEYTSIERMIGAPVYLQASAEAIAEAQREGEKADRPKAKVTEWIVENDGKLAAAVVSIGGFLGIGDKTVLVPANELTWNNSMERYDLGWTKAQLQAKPNFDLDAATKTGLDQACADVMKDRANTDGTVKDTTAKDREKVAADASMKTDRTVAGTTFQRPAHRLCKASEIAKLPVYAGAAEWGSTRDLIVDRAKNKVVLAVVNNGGTLGVGGTDYLIAYPHFTVAAKDGDERLLCAHASTPEQLAASVKFEKPKNGVVDPDAAKRAMANAPTGKS